MEQVKLGQLWLLLSAAEADWRQRKEVIVKDTRHFLFTQLGLDTRQQWFSCQIKMSCGSEFLKVAVFVTYWVAVNFMWAD